MARRGKDPAASKAAPKKSTLREAGPQAAALSAAQSPSSLAKRSTADEAQVRRGSAPVLRVRAGAILLGAVLGIVCARVAYEQRLEVGRARLAAMEGDSRARMQHLARAMRWRLPLIGAQGRVARELASLCEGLASESEHEQAELALSCDLELRAALLATQSGCAPDAAGSDLLSAVEGRLARALAAREPLAADLAPAYEDETTAAAASSGGEESSAGVQDRAGPFQSSDEATAWHRERMTHRERALTASGVLASLSFVAFLAASAALMLCGFAPSGRLKRPAGVRWLLAVALLCVAWMVGLSCA